MTGSFINRMMEGIDYTNGNLKVGTYVTEYLYTDRNAYVVTNVKDEKHFTMKRANDNTDDHLIEVVKRGGTWYTEKTLSKKSIMKIAKKNFYDKGAIKTLESAYNYLLFIADLTDSQIKRIEDGKEVKKLNKINISIGVNDPYRDPSF